MRPRQPCRKPDRATSLLAHASTSDFSAPHVPMQAPAHQELAFPVPLEGLSQGQRYSATDSAVVLIPFRKSAHLRHISLSSELLAALHTRIRKGISPQDQPQSAPKLLLIRRRQSEQIPWT